MDQRDIGIKPEALRLPIEGAEGRAGGHVPIISTLVRLVHKDCYEFKAIFKYRVRPCHQSKRKEGSKVQGQGSPRLRLPEEDFSNTGYNSSSSQWDCVKLERFCWAKNTTSRVEGWPIE